jgi:hypothetical protein
VQRERQAPGRSEIGVATMATLSVRSRSLSRSLARRFRVTVRIVRTVTNRFEHCTESTSWGSLVRAQYRPSHEGPANAGLSLSQLTMRPRAWQGNGKDATLSRVGLSVCECGQHLSCRSRRASIGGSKPSEPAAAARRSSGRNAQPTRGWISSSVR